MTNQEFLDAYDRRGVGDLNAMRAEMIARYEQLRAASRERTQAGPEWWTLVSRLQRETLAMRELCTAAEGKQPVIAACVTELRSRLA